MPQIYLWAKSSLDHFWTAPCQRQDPLSRLPSLAGHRSTGGDSFLATDLDNDLATQAALAHHRITGVDERIHTNIATSGIQGLDPRVLHPSIQQATALYNRTEVTTTVAFEAVDADGNRFMQEADEALVYPAEAKAHTTPITFAFLPRPNMEARAPPHPGHEGTPNLTATRAILLAREHRQQQRQLTQILRNNLRGEEYAAAHCSGVAPVFL